MLHHKQRSYAQARPLIPAITSNIKFDRHRAQLQQATERIRSFSKKDFLWPIYLEPYGKLQVLNLFPCALLASNNSCIHNYSTASRNLTNPERQLRKVHWTLWLAFSEELIALGLRSAILMAERVGSFCFQADRTVLGWSPSSSRGVQGHAPRENFGRMEPNPAILCTLAVKNRVIAAWSPHKKYTEIKKKN